MLGFNRVPGTVKLRILGKPQKVCAPNDGHRQVSRNDYKFSGEKIHSAD